MSLNKISTNTPLHESENTEESPLATALLEWYFNHQRTLPWRENHDPYRIWLSEIMLQQTQVATVIDYFNRFTKTFPTVFDLAKASEDQVFKLWEGLGYYSRARNIMRCAKVLVEDYGGVFPRELAKALKLPGVGPYTAGAVLSIAYNEPVPAVDGNVMRVMSRLYAKKEDIGDPKTRPLIEALVMEVLPHDRRHFNQALMELGATVCTPKNPQCEGCPIQSHCLAKATGQTQSLPVKLQKIKKTSHLVPVAYVTCNDQVLIIRRPSEGLLSGLWAFPTVELEASSEAKYTKDPSQLGLFSTEQEEIQALKNWFSENMDMALPMTYEFLGEVKHVFTHKTWQLRLWHFKVEKPVYTDLPESQWVTRKSLSDFALPTAFVKLIQKSLTPKI